MLGFIALMSARTPPMIGAGRAGQQSRYDAQPRPYIFASLCCRRTPLDTSSGSQVRGRVSQRPRHRISMAAAYHLRTNLSRANARTRLLKPLAGRRCRLSNSRTRHGDIHRAAKYSRFSFPSWPRAVILPDFTHRIRKSSKLASLIISGLIQQASAATK